MFYKITTNKIKEAKKDKEKTENTTQKITLNFKYWLIDSSEPKWVKLLSIKGRR